ncbi:hypothetical protein EJB05_16003, partial [Eragrostis curvula]
MTLSPLNTERNHLLLSPKQQQSPRDGLRSPRVSCKTTTIPSPRSRTTTKMARGGGGGLLERSLSFKNWEAAVEEAAAPPRSTSSGINGARPGTLAVHQPSPRSTAAAAPAAAVSPAQQAVLEYFSPRPLAELDEAATRLQKVFKGHRTRRSLADCAIVIEELWWKAYDSASLNIKSISFFDVDKQETAASRWSRAGKRIAKVGKGLSKDDKAQKLALQHWLEAIDPRHRYGHNLHLYYDIWSASSSTEPFFYWLDIGAGREVHHAKCPRSKLYSQLIMYLGPVERAAYEVVVEEGRLVYKESGVFVHTNEESKWIFVLSTSRSLYIGQKKKGKFQHSSFLSGAATTAAGRLVAKEGVLKAIWPYSGHYLPTEENFREFISFLEENNVDLANVKRCSVDDDEFPSFKKKTEEDEVPAEAAQENEAANDADVELPAVDIVKVEEVADAAGAIDDKAAAEPEKMMMMASRPSFKWMTPTGARIGCLRDYPADLQSMALEQVNLSPRVVPSPSGNRLPIPSPRPSPRIRLSPRLHYMGLPTPTGVRLPIPSPAPAARRSPGQQPQQQFAGFHTPPVELTLPKHKSK